MRYIPLTESDRAAMLDSIGIKSSEDLFAEIPTSIRFKEKVDLPSAMTEGELLDYFGALSKKSRGVSDGWKSFLGGGAYSHYIPVVVDALSSRSEFATAYTPYQPEISQGTLQAIYEFQSMIASLFEMEVANASMYEGASSSAEAILMALRIKRKSNRIYISEGLHPEYVQVLKTYLRELDVEIKTLKLNSKGQTQMEALEESAAVMVQSPNFFGVIEDLKSLSTHAKKAKALSIAVTTEALSFGILKAPGAFGMDIVVGEGQALGNPVNFSGPYLGLFATKKEFLRKLPGRLVGRAQDSEGRPGYVLTLSTREQHIRREKATSNICTNQSLCALRASIYMATLGQKGLREIALRNLRASERLKKGLKGIHGVELVYSGPTFNEFLIRLEKPAEDFLRKMEEQKILAGIPLSKYFPDRGNELIVSATELHSDEDLDLFVEHAGKIL